MIWLTMELLPLNFEPSNHSAIFMSKQNPLQSSAACRWTLQNIEVLFDLSFNDLIYQAHQVHRQNFDANNVQLSTLLNIKTGACPEDCAYCSQSARHKSPLKVEKLMSVEEVREAASKAKKNGATRFCMGAAWRQPKDRDLSLVEEMIRTVSDLGMETCVTLGMLQRHQAERLKKAGLDYYNHNIDTSESYYPEVITTRTFTDRLQTLERVQQAGINVCCGGIIGMGESREDRISMLQTLAQMSPQPESVPINQLVPNPGTPLANQQGVDVFDVIRTIAVARIILPKSMIRLSAGRDNLSEEAQAMCFFAGANSVFYGERLLTTNNQDCKQDQALFARLGIGNENIAVKINPLPD